MAVEIVRQADLMQAERRRDELKILADALSKAVGSAVAQSIARLFKS